MKQWLLSYSFMEWYENLCTLHFVSNIAFWFTLIYSCYVLTCPFENHSSLTVHLQNSYGPLPQKWEHCWIAQQRVCGNNPRVTMMDEAYFSCKPKWLRHQVIHLFHPMFENIYESGAKFTPISFTAQSLFLILLCVDHPVDENMYHSAGITGSVKHTVTENLGHGFKSQPHWHRQMMPQT